jgi:hypothetical protein
LQRLRNDLSAKNSRQLEIFMGLETQFIAPLFALVGTLVVAALGFFQWRKQHANPNRAAIADARRKAVEALWTQLERENLSLRSLQPSSREAIRAAKIEVNKIFLQHSLYLDDELQLQLNHYVEAMHKVADILLERGEDSEQEDWTSTLMMRYSEDDADLMKAIKEMNELRDLVRSKLQSYLSM